MSRSWISLALLSIPALAGAVDIDSVQGAYHYSFANSDISGNKTPGEDVLEIVRISADTAYVRAHLDFYNGHTCSLWGVADLKGDSLVYRSQKIPGCELTLSFSPDGVVLSDRDGACRAECGVRGSFDGMKFPAKSRRAITYLQRLLESRQYKEALAERGNTDQ